VRLKLEQAAEKILRGEVVAIPTETVYGLAAKFDMPSAVQKVYELKDRPPENPLIIHLQDSASIYPFVDSVPEGFDFLAKKFWPGPLTLVIPIKEHCIAASVRAGLSTQAFRVPDHPMTRSLLRMTGPLVAPSANLSGNPSTVAPDQVENDFGLGFPVLDGGRCREGIESTILVFKEGSWQVGRLGAIPVEAFYRYLGYLPKTAKVDETPLCPGQSFRHYAPKAKLHFGEDLQDASVIIGFSDRKYPSNATLFSLGNSTLPIEAAYSLYTVLRELDRKGICEAWIDAEIPQGGLWNTIIERLKKASS
jgi:L-threonylcarbamoyladenylate synthase